MILATLLFALSSAHADTVQPLLTATSDAFSGECKISLVVDDDLIARAIEVKSPTEISTFPIEGLGEGMVLVTASDQKVIILQSDAFDPRSGGELKLNYLVSGINGKRREVVLEGNRTGSTWNLLINDSAGRRIVLSAYFKANKFLGKVIGLVSVAFK